MGCKKHGNGIGEGRKIKFITDVLDESILPFRTLEANCTPAWKSARRPGRKLKFSQWNTTIIPRKHAAELPVIQLSTQTWSLRMNSKRLQKSGKALLMPMPSLNNELKPALSHCAGKLHCKVQLE